jgi:hypothetical protein
MAKLRKNEEKYVLEQERESVKRGSGENEKKWPEAIVASGPFV